MGGGPNIIISQYLERIKNTHNTGIVSNTTLFKKLSNINQDMQFRLSKFCKIWY